MPLNRIDPIVLEQIIKTQIPAVVLGAAGFFFATSNAKSAMSLASTRGVEAEQAPQRTWPGVVLAACASAIMLYGVLSQKVEIKWPISSALDSTWWVALAGAVLAIVWAMLGTNILGPLRDAAARRSQQMKVALAVVLLAALVTCIWFAAWLPVHGKVETWTTSQQVWRLVSAFVLSKLFVGGMIALARKATFGHVLAMSGVVGLAAQLFALDFDGLRFALITGAIAVFLLVGAVIVAMRSAQHSLSRVGIIACAAAFSVLMVNIVLQASLFGGANERDALIYASAIAVAPWAALLIDKLATKVFGASAKAGSLGAVAVTALAPSLGVVLVFAPAIALSVIRSGVLEDPMY
jgi:hypothetical protein